MYVKACLLEDPIVDFLADLFVAVVDISFDDENVLLVATLFEMDGFILLLDLFLDEELRKDAVVILLLFLFIGQIDM